jgi:alpha-L-fucosidase 2
MKNIVFTLILIFLLVSCNKERLPEGCSYNLTFSSLPVSWDEGIPLGNGMTGVLIWEKEGKLRFSLDRADLWDLRPMGNIGSDEFKFSWVYDKWKRNNYQAVQEKFDVPYEELPAPSKIPAAALEFDTRELGKIKQVILNLNKAECIIRWVDGAEMEIFVDALGELGWYRIINGTLQDPKLIPPGYDKNGKQGAGYIPAYGLNRLGYITGEVRKSDQCVNYLQKGWGGFEYSVSAAWKSENGKTTGCWKIESNFQAKEAGTSSFQNAKIPSEIDFRMAQEEHFSWWNKFWAASSISLPDTILEKQWYLEMYKFGSVARAETPPISLQAVWTADNGMLPPWKGDFHHDLNTELSYWPAYSANHTDLSKGFTNWLWDNRETFEKYTRQYFGTEGLNVPGVSTLTGEPMGGWIQYSFGPTVSAWLAQHFYLQWRYTLDTVFLKEQAYPWICEVGKYIEDFSVYNEQGQRKLPLSSSPEFNDNTRQAWFSNTTNFDLALIRWTYKAAAEMASALGKKSDVGHWEKCLSEWPDLAIDDKTGLMIAPGYPYSESHRHFSHLMSVHPLGLIDWSTGVKEKEIISKSLKNLHENGTDFWTGYSYAWLGNLYARAFRGDDAVKALRTFAECFCLPNSLHVNGDQSGTGKSKFTYRPFTLEGNFAFAAGIQEILLQSHTGIIRVFPAIPANWKDVSFKTLRAMGAVLVSAEMKDGVVNRIVLTSEKGGTVRLANPFGQKVPYSDKAFRMDNDIIILKTKPGETIVLKNS